jgi:hypothetical protein
MPQRTFFVRTRLFIGQTHCFSKPNPLVQGTGINKGVSDYVGHLQADPHPWISLDGRIRLSRDELQAVFSEASAELGPEISRVGLNYIHLSPSSSLKDEREPPHRTAGPNLGFAFQQILVNHFKLIPWIERRWTFITSRRNHL